MNIPSVYISFIFLAAFSLFSAFHVVLYKRDPRSSFGWIVTCLVFIGIGPILYWLFGINRIRTHAKRIYQLGYINRVSRSGENKGSIKFSSKNLARVEKYKGILNVSEKVNRHPLTFGNKVTILFNGEKAYPAMLEAIRNAKKFVYLCTYIFDSDDTGKKFVKELASAKKRGVKVNVLVDSVGEWYSYPRISYLLKKEGIEIARFMPLSLSVNSLHFNLRNHRKSLIVDGQVGFIGGMNIRSRHVTKFKNSIKDIHFKVEGLAVLELQKVFLEDWYFSTHHKLPQLTNLNVGPTGSSICRAVCSGPNEDFEKLNWILFAVLSWAEKTVRIMTPYFLPDRVLITALNAAALRGVSVKVLLPVKNNLPFIDWANRAILWEMIENGIQFYYQPEPFSHSKLLVVDNEYAVIGSSNWDSRSLRLNFELDLEVYDPIFSTKLSRHFDLIKRQSKVITMKDLKRDPLPTRFRNSLCKLFLPYL